MSNDLLEQKAQILGSLLLFTQIFYELRTGREFELSQPIGRESHYITVCRALMRVFDGEITRLIINLPPRYGKTEIIIQFIAWCLAHYADSNFIYVSYAHMLAKKQTQTVRQIMQMPLYKRLFNIELSSEASAKDNFETSAGGSVYAAGAQGTIVGRGAGIQNCNRFGGAIIIDDIHKPSEALSDTIRGSTNEWYLNTLQSRGNSAGTPIIFIGQRVHEDDLAANLMEGFDGHEWERLIIPALDEAGNALNPKRHTSEMLKNMQQKMAYEFAAQYQQGPQPAGGGLFKEDCFPIFDEDPEILETFITADTAETKETYNDPTVFSFWGIYKINVQNIDTGLYGVHWIDCYELWVEPKDLKPEFMQFWSECMRYPVKPKKVAIEKKSTGATLISVLKEIQGMQVIAIERTAKDGSKGARFLEMQPYISTKQVSFTEGRRHVKSTIDHMVKITANDTHRHDDRADTCYDAIKLGLIDKSIYIPKQQNLIAAQTAKQTLHNYNKLNELKAKRYGYRN